MPNFWTKTNQKIVEAFNGVRTKDIEFDTKVEEMKIIEKGINNLRLVFSNFSTNTLSIKNLCKDLNLSIKYLYDKNSPYYSLSKEIYATHLEIENIYENFNHSVSNILSRTSEWSLMFIKAKQILLQREEKRKCFDHYDEKLEKLYKNKSEKNRKYIPETKK